MPHHLHASWRTLGATLVLAFGVGVLAASADAKTWPSKKPPAAERGRQIYDTHCMSCHGSRGAGDGPAAADLVAEIPDFSDGFGDRGREELSRSVMRGKGAMPAYELVFEREDGDAVIQHMANVGTMVDTETKKAEDEPEEEDDEVQREAGAPPE